jgi:hypothetical protein
MTRGGSAPVIYVAAALSVFGSRADPDFIDPIWPGDISRKQTIRDLKTRKIGSLFL